MSTTHTTSRINHLDAIRAIGALVVVACHFQMLFVPGLYGTLYGIFARYVPGRYMPVLMHFLDLSIIGNLFIHLFWMLSGYVLFRPFFERAAQPDLFAFAVKRYLRLMLPCAVAVFLSYGLLASGLMPIHRILPPAMEGRIFAAPPSLFTALKTAVWSNQFHFSGTPGYNEPLWTIEKEFYGSLCCTALFGLTRKLRGRYIYYAIFFLCAFLLHLPWLNSFLLGYALADYDYPVRQPALPLAGRIDQAARRHQNSCLLLAALLYGAGFLATFRFPDKLNEINGILGFVLLFISLRVKIIERVAGNRLLLALGWLSFGLYVLHVPVMGSFTAWALLLKPAGGRVVLLLIFLATLLLVTALAGLFTLYVDQPAVRLAARVNRYIARRSSSSSSTGYADPSTKATGA